TPGAGGRSGSGRSRGEQPLALASAGVQLGRHALAAGLELLADAGDRGEQGIHPAYGLVDAVAHGPVAEDVVEPDVERPRQLRDPHVTDRLEADVGELGGQR